MHEDTRFKKKITIDRFYCDMCNKCGLCCIDRDWSTVWNGELVGVCHNLKDGSCIDESKKSLKCRIYYCKDFNEWVARMKTIVSRKCPTATRMVQETLLRKEKHITDEEAKRIQEVLNG